MKLFILENYDDNTHIVLTNVDDISEKEFEKMTNVIYEKFDEMNDFVPDVIDFARALIKEYGFEYGDSITL